MTILFVTENLGSGGAERQLTRLANAFKNNGHNPIVVTWIDKNFHGEYLQQKGIEHILLNPKNKLDRVFRIASIIRNKKANAVISYLSMANETCIFAKLLSPVKLIVSERSFTSSWTFKTKIRYFFYRFANKIVTNSNNEANNIKLHCKNLSGKILTIHNFVELEKFKLRNFSNIMNNQKIIIGVGRVIPSKNIIRLIQALGIVYRKGYDFVFNWFGDTYDKEYLKEINKTIESNNLNGKFILRGECKDIFSEYQKANFLVMPSLIEGYPNVMIEAMASGLPIAASNICENPYIMQDGINGVLFNPYSIQEIENSIITLLSLTESQTIQIGRNNRNKTEVNNSIDNLYHKYLEIL